MSMGTAKRSIVWYARVSSDDQRERATIQTQIEELERAVARTPGVVVVERYIDDGVSGMIPIAARPAGGRLVRDRLAGRFAEVWVYDVDRLGRDAPDIMRARCDLAALGISIFTPAGEVPPLLFDLQAVMGDYARVQFLKRSSDGMARAARDGRYTGGIVAFGYRVEGARQTAHLVPDESPLIGDLSAAEVVRRMYHHLGVDGWSCRRIAVDLNALGVPTAYARDERLVRRGTRQERTRGIWRAGRVRNLVTNPLYHGHLQYGRRSTSRTREVITARVEALVADELWTSAQEALARNRIAPKNTARVYLLRGVVTCGVCRLRYIGSQGRPGAWWYRCGGRTADRGPFSGRCTSHYLPGADAERIIWSDIERFLRDPGEILAELDGTREREQAEAVAASEALTLSRRLDQLQDERAGFLRLAARGTLTDAELDEHLDRIAADRGGIDCRLVELRGTSSGVPVPPGIDDLVARLRAALDAGLTDMQRHEIVAGLVRVTVHAEVGPDGQPRTRLLIDYAFPGGLSTRTGTGSSPRRAMPYAMRARICARFSRVSNVRSAARYSKPPMASAHSTPAGRPIGEPGQSRSTGLSRRAAASARSVAADAA
jgi:site-specific DNA recombinase